MELFPVLRQVCFSLVFPYSSSRFPLLLHTVASEPLDVKDLPVVRSIATISVPIRSLGKEIGYLSIL